MSNISIDSQVDSLIENFKYEGEFGFGKLMVPVMMEMKYANGSWSQMHFKPYAPLQIDPAAKVLHYAQEIFEGMKAYKNEEGEVFLFRPEMNAKRFNQSAWRMAMPPVPEESFIQAVSKFSASLEKHVPTGMNKSLYLRPFMIATEPTLGVRASNEYSFFVIGCLAESYFARPNVKVMVELENCRAAPGGVGFAKTGANYGASLLAFNKTQQAQFDQTLWLDAIEKKYIEELSGMNFFAVVGSELITPSLTDTILAGITRDSILKIAEDFGLKPIEKKLSIEELVRSIDDGECAEAFACGTASVLTPVQSIKYKNTVHQLKHENGLKSQEIKQFFLKLQRGMEKDKLGWAVKVN